jgi:LCP family protein required for cell wall assembly
MMTPAMSFTSRRLRDEPPRRAVPWHKVAFGLFQVGRPVAEWWLTYWAKKKEEKAKKEHRWAILKRVGLIFGVSAVVLVLAAGGVKALIATKLLNVRDVATLAATDLAKDAHGHTNILLLGQGDETHDGVDLTDTIMIASLDPGTKSAVLLSVPRDLYVLKTENMGVGRINALYRDYKYILETRQGLSEAEASQAAMRELSAEIGRMLALEIHHVIKVDFVGFVKAVDAIGGVQVDVPYAIVDREYPGPNYSYQTFAIDAGPQTLDGETALKYARSRHTTSDFSRSARQQQILKSMAEKIKNDGLLSHPSRMLSLLQIMQDHVETTLTAREMMGLGNLGAQIDQANILSMQLNTENGLYGSGVAPGGFLYFPPREDFGGASVILPVSIPPFPVTWKQIQSLTQLLFDVRGPYLARPTFRILNAGAPSGAARLLGNELVRYGFEVESTENAEEKLDTSYVEADAAQADVGAFFAELLVMENRASPPETAASSSSPSLRPIVIVLGKDYAYESIQALLAPAEQAASDASL